MTLRTLSILSVSLLALGQIGADGCGDSHEPDEERARTDAGTPATDGGATSTDGGADTCEPEECGPAPAFEERCPDGVHTSYADRCERRADGSCGWHIVECPESDCDAEECGPMPGTPAYTCPDGSLGGNIGLCERDETGTCDWVFRECPDDESADGSTPDDGSGGA